MSESWDDQHGTTGTSRFEGSAVMSEVARSRSVMNVAAPVCEELGWGGVGVGAHWCAYGAQRSRLSG